jgi:DNA-binding beta-propeller fold protein YncE
VRARRRGRLLAGVGLLGLTAVAIIIAWPAIAGNDAPARAAKPAATTRRVVSSGPVHVVERPRGSLQTPVQDAAAAPLPDGRAMLLGGLTAADSSRTDIRIASLTSDRAAGALPTALHDTAAVRLGAAVYLFGGGTGSNTQTDQIVRVPVGGGVAVKAVGRLPAPSSDQAAAAIGDTAYIVGGYTGSRWLNTIVAWKPGRASRVVAHLPFTLRYAAVTVLAGRLVIAGGSLEHGSASNLVLEYTPGGHVVRLGRLPQPTTHAAAASLHGVVYVIGGRGAGLDTPNRRIVAVTLAGHIEMAGALRTPRSDLAAVSVGDGILLAGGRSNAGTQGTLSELIPQAVKKSVAARRATQAAHISTSVSGADGASMLTGAARKARPLVYVPDSESATVDVIDPRTYRVVEHFAVGLLPQHVVPGWDLRTLYVTNDLGNSLTAIDPRTGKPGRTIPVEDPYNMYFTPDGRFAIVVAERLRRLDFRDPHTFALRHSLSVPCAGVDHMDFAANGRFLIASCEFSGQLVKVDLARQRVIGVLTLPDGAHGMPQDVRVSPDGRTFYVADLTAGGVWKVDGRRFRVVGFVRTGAGAHGLYPGRDGRLLYVSNRGAGSVSVLSFRTQKVLETWRLRGGGSPDMGGVSADGKVLWLSGRYNSEVYAISTRTGRLLARIHVGAGPHGVCVWPQPGRYSLGHTDNMR